MKQNVLSWLYSAVTVLSIGCSGHLANRTPEASSQKRSTPELMIQYGCPACHVIPGVPGAVGKVGPSLESLAQRSYLTGTLPNSSTNLQAWIMHPQRFHPGTAMPEMGVTPSDARQIAIYLRTSP
jgi:cytochrome c